MLLRAGLAPRQSTDARLAGRYGAGVPLRYRAELSTLGPISARDPVVPSGASLLSCPVSVYSNL